MITALENNDTVVGIFLDFSKAFDTVDHDILLSKLFHYGIIGPAHKWFTSYISNRKQYVTYNGTSSTMRNITCGVPQGSILGPLLFFIYINDLCKVCNFTAPILFADDTNLFCNGCYLQVMEKISTGNSKKFQNGWRRINYHWMVKKTHYMVFSKRRTRKTSLKLIIDGESIGEVQNTKFLGIIIDNKLNWKDHISYIAG